MCFLSPNVKRGNTDVNGILIKRAEQNYYFPLQLTNSKPTKNPKAFQQWGLIIKADKLTGLFPFDGRWWFATDIINNTRNTINFVNNTIRNQT